MCVLCVGWCVCRHGSVEGGVCMCVCMCGKVCEFYYLYHMLKVKK